MDRHAKPRKRTAKTPKRTVLATGKHLALVRAEQWEYVERTNACGVVAVIAVTDEGQLLLTEQYRPPVQARVIDLPAGLAGDEGDCDEDLETAARRELREECGYEADRFIRLEEVPTTPGLTSERVTLFRATGLRRVDRGGGTGSEEIAVHRVALGKIGAWLARKRKAKALIDLKVYAGLYFTSSEADAIG